MPLPGGAADKYGNRYELKWTVACMSDVMDERAEAIRLEPPGPEGEGIEFWLRKAGQREYHQVKRQHTGMGHWSLGQLARMGVLANIQEMLMDPAAVFVFVSAQSANELNELADRARRSSCLEEYKGVFLRSSQQLSASFSTLCAHWPGWSEEEGYRALQRMRISTASEDVLDTLNETQLETLVEGDATTVSDVLANFALEKVHHELTAHDIWSHLESRGFQRRSWGNDRHVLAAVSAANDQYLSVLQSQAILGKPIPRAEPGAILRAFDPPSDRHSVLVTGEAGVGKSGVILQTVKTLVGRGLPIVAFRVDRLEPTSRPDEVGRQLGLPGSPAAVLGGIAQGRESVLIIDQLDSVSFTSGRHPDFFDCINHIVHQALSYPHMRLLLACRKYDLENDHRLKGLTSPRGMAKVVAVGRLDDDTVRQVVQEIGLDAGRLSDTQVRLLSLPLHLRLLTEVAKDRGIQSLGFGTARDLYDEFWDRKQEVIRAHLGYANQWAQVVDALCRYMSDRQELSAPESILDEWPHYARAMASENVLVYQSGRYSFFHEGFFDYAFARRFVGRGGSLVQLLASGEQHLFRRAQVRQILLYQRDADRRQYLADLRALLNRQDVRFHIKSMVFALLAPLSDPTEGEWHVIEPLLTSTEDPRAAGAWGMLHSSVPWFTLLDSLGMMTKWLAKEEYVDRAIWLLRSVQRQLADRVAELLEPHVEDSQAWRNRLVYVIVWADIGSGRRFFDLFLKLLDKGFLDEARGPIAVNSDFWSLTYTLSKRHPDWACEVIGHYLNRRLALSLQAGQPNPFDHETGTIPDSQLDEKIFLNAAKGAPSAFVKEVLPFMLRIMELTAPQSEIPRRDRIWRFRLYGGGHAIDDTLLNAAETALSILAKDTPDTFAAIAASLRSLEFETVQFLLIRAYAAAAEWFAGDAADYLCECPERLSTGYASSACWAGRQLLEAITPHCSDERLGNLEKTILAYYSTWERTRDGRCSYGHAQFVLLQGIDPSRRSAAVVRRLQELQRKFGSEKRTEPRSIETAWIGPPVPEAAADKMKDADWLKAMARYNRDSERFGQDGRFTGGVYELSRLLEGQAKKQPRRFAMLALRFPDDTHPDYFDSVLRGVQEASLDLGSMTMLWRRCHSLPGKPCGRWISASIEKFAESTLPDDVLDIAVWYATEAADPQQELWRAESGGGTAYYGGDILSAGVNSVRGAAAEAIAQLIFKDGNRLDFLAPALDKMVADRSIAVRSVVAEVTRAVLVHNRDLAVSLFTRLCTTEDALLATHNVETFLFYASLTHFDELQAIIKRMIESDETGVATVGARQACVASLRIEEAVPLARSCLSGTRDQRQGAAEVFAHNLRVASLRSFCEQALEQLFHDSEEEVRRQAAECFGAFEQGELGEYAALVEAFAGSEAFATNYFPLIHALERSTARLPQATCLVCERFLDVVGVKASDISTSASADAHVVSQLIVRVYAQSDNDPVMQARCLDVIDRMAQVGAHGLEKVFNLYER